MWIVLNQWRHFALQRRDLLAGVSVALRPFIEINSLSNNVLVQLLLYDDKNLSSDVILMYCLWEDLLTPQVLITLNKWAHFFKIAQTSGSSSALYKITSKSSPKSLDFEKQNFSYPVYQILPKKKLRWILNSLKVPCRYSKSETFVIRPCAIIFVAKKLKFINLDIKGAGSRNVNKLLSKWRFCSTFDRPYHRGFLLFFSKWRCYFEDGLLSFEENQPKPSYVVRLQRYWWIFGSNFLVDSPHPPESVQNTMVYVWVTIKIIEITGLFTVTLPCPFNVLLRCFLFGWSL